MKCSYYAAEQGPKNLGSLYSKTIFVVSKDISVCINVHSNKTKKHKNPIVNTDQAINAGLKCLYRRESKGKKCADTIGTVLVPWAGHFQR